jgi:hypothetical protein
MKPTLSTPNTLILGIWHADDRAAITGTLLDCQCEAVPDVLTATGPAWPALAEALTVAAAVDPAHVLILSNDAALVKALSPPFRPPTPTAWQRIWVAKGEYGNVGLGGDPAHWQVLVALGMRWGGNFRAMQVDDLPRAQQLWQSQR